MSLGMLFVGFFALDRVAKKEETVKVQGKMVQEVNGLTEIEEPGIVVQLESLPNAEKEAAKWNAIVPQFIELYPEFKYDATQILKDESNSNNEITTFSHEFNTAVKINLVYTVNNDTSEITEMRLVCHDTGSDSAAIFHAMSMFINYVDQEVSIERAGEFLAENPYTLQESGVYEYALNGKKFEYELDREQAIHSMVYRIK